ncbi:MAG: hypothetical protein KF857_11700 [Fimbriimonadaceae bacterium]|nr:hypothetical protein [Fimbriimonadaceae bacterium]
MLKRIFAVLLVLGVMVMTGCQKEETTYTGETKTATDQGAGKEGRQGKGLPQPSLD